MFMDVRMCECIVCMKGKSMKYQRVASGHQTFNFLIILAHRSLPAQMAMRIKFGAQIMNQVWPRGFFPCSGRILFYAPNIRCANKLARYK
jgi:hypothetical protein